MRMGLNGRGLKPHHVTRYGIMGIGILILLWALPLYIYAAAVGGLIVYVGYSLRSKS